MLYEIWSDKFRTGGKDGQIRPAIRFHTGLNTVLGTQTRSNSIGKSTFLMIIDYVFGGSDYLDTDAHVFVGEHEIYFTFRFGDTLHRFCRKTIDKDVVYLCENCTWDEEQSRLERIRLREENAKDAPALREHDLNPYVLTRETLRVDEYCKLLFKEYAIESENISFRNIVGRYFRVYGRPNHDEYQPLHNTPREKDSEAITALQRLFGETQQIKDLKANEKAKDEERKAYKAAQKYHLVRHITTKTGLKAAQEERDKLQTELTELLRSKDREAEQADLSRSNEAAAINRKLATLRRNRSRLKSQLEALYINIDGHTAVSRGDLSDLAHFFPEANISELQSIENFHQKLRGVLEAEMSEERSELQSSIATINAEISTLQEQLRSIGIPTRLPTPFLTKHAELTMRIKDLDAQIGSFQENKDVDEAHKSAAVALKAAQEKELPRIAGEINAQMVRISDEILGPEREAPRLDLKDGKSYTFGTSTNRGTGNNYKNLIIYDLSILTKTALPAIIHDSFLLTDIGDTPTGAIVKQYIKIAGIGKQVFIALDKTKSYGEDTDKDLNSNQVLYLCENGGELFGWSWDQRSGEN
jgi:hypothetical protein